jgi:acyl-CoA synthetase (AMP-forming)/AMP-acid ligase II
MARAFLIGCTEGNSADCAFCFLDMTGEEAFGNVTNCGLLYPGLEWKIVDPEDFDKELRQDGEAQGELLMRGPWVASAYYKNPQPTKFHHGWLATGDIASITKGGAMVIKVLAARACVCCCHRRCCCVVRKRRTLTPLQPNDHMFL